MEASQTPAAPNESGWDSGYEYRVVTLMALGFGLVGLDRYIIFPLFSVIREDLGLDYQDLGLISAALAFTWGLSAIYSGNLTDKIGAKRVAIVSIIAFSALVACTGLANGLISLVILRALMGFAEGGFVPASIVQTIRVSKPERVGLNFGVQQMAAPLFGLGFGPIIAVGLLAVLPGWEWVFATISLPGFVLAYFVLKTVKPDDPALIASVPSDAAKAPKVSFGDALKYRNVIFGALTIIFIFVALNALSTFGPTYLTDYIELSDQGMGLVTACLGAGGLIGMIALPALSDIVGRKPVMCAALLVQVIAAGFMQTATAETPPPILALYFFAVSSSASGTIAILIGPVISASVPMVVAATATGIVTGLGEIFGGAGGPFVTGFIAEANGIQSITLIMLIAALLGLITVLFGIEEPKKLHSTTPEASPAG
ncbi:MAG: MFS transporter [Pseudomonadota bacterium]